MFFGLGYKDNTLFQIKKFFYYYFITIFAKITNMARKKIDKKELITLVKCWVKAKHVVKVQKEIAAIEKKYSG